MSSEVDICNLALSRVGDAATLSSINPPEGSAQAEHCARFYPIARDSLLEMHPWGFAIRRVSLALLSNLPTWDWTYAYAQPTDALNLLAVLPYNASSDDQTVQYSAETAADGTEIILTNEADASLLYSARISDTTKFSPLFTDALAWLLASDIAGPILKGDAGAAMAKSCYGSFRVVLSQAIVSDANQRRIRPDHTPPWMKDRDGKSLTSWDY